MKLTDKQINTYIEETAAYTSREAFASDVSISAYDAAGLTDDIDPEFVEQVARLWDVIRLPFRDLLAAFGIGQTACARRFCIGVKTVQRWCSASDSYVRECAPYIRLMMAELLGYLNIRA